MQATDHHLDQPRNPRNPVSTPRAGDPKPRSGDGELAGEFRTSSPSPCGTIVVASGMSHARPPVLRPPGQEYDNAAKRPLSSDELSPTRSPAAKRTRRVQRSKPVFGVDGGVSANGGGGGEGSGTMTADIQEGGPSIPRTAASHATRRKTATRRALASEPDAHSAKPGSRPWVAGDSGGNGSWRRVGPAISDDTMGQTPWAQTPTPGGLGSPPPRLSASNPLSVTTNLGNHQLDTIPDYLSPSRRPPGPRQGPDLPHGTTTYRTTASSPTSFSANAVMPRNSGGTVDNEPSNSSPAAAKMTPSRLSRWKRQRAATDINQAGRGNGSGELSSSLGDRPVTPPSEEEQVEDEPALNDALGGYSAPAGTDSEILLHEIEGLRLQVKQLEHERSDMVRYHDSALTILQQQQREEKTSLEREMSSLEEKLARQEDLTRTESDRRIRSAGEDAERIKLLEATVLRLETGRDDLAEQRKRDELTTASCQVENMALRDENTALRNEIARLEHLQQELEASAVTKLREATTLAVAEHRLAARKTSEEVVALKKKVEEERRTHAQGREDLAQAQAAAGAFADGNEVLKARVQALDNSATVASQQIAELKKTIGEEQHRLAESQEAVTRTHADNKLLESRVQSLKDAACQISKELTQARDELQGHRFAAESRGALRTKIRELEASEAAKTQQIADLEKLQQQTENSLEECYKSAPQVGGSLSNLRDVLKEHQACEQGRERLQREIKLLKETLEANEKELANGVRERDFAREKLERYEQGTKIASGEAEALRGELQKALEEKDARIKALELVAKPLELAAEAQDRDLAEMRETLAETQYQARRLAEEPRDDKMAAGEIHKSCIVAVSDRDAIIKSRDAEITTLRASLDARSSDPESQTTEHQRQPCCAAWVERSGLANITSPSAQDRTIDEQGATIARLEQEVRRLSTEMKSTQTAMKQWEDLNTVSQGQAESKSHENNQLRREINRLRHQLASLQRQVYLATAARTGVPSTVATARHEGTPMAGAGPRQETGPGAALIPGVASAPPSQWHNPLLPASGARTVGVHMGASRQAGPRQGFGDQFTR